MLLKTFQLNPFAVFLSFLLFIPSFTQAQFGKSRYWSPDGYQYTELEKGEIVQNDMRNASKKTTLISQAVLTPTGQNKALSIRRYRFSGDGQKILLNVNTRRVWRYDTRGDYWVYDLKANTLQQLGKGHPESSLMFAKFSPDGAQVAYVSEHNLYVEELVSGTIKQLTTDGTRKLINGTFDWTYEEEFGCRDGFRWSPDGKSVAYWQIDATNIRNFLMINNTDSIYSFVVPVEYPKVGENPSACKVGVVEIASGKTTWMNVPGDPVQHYIPRMEWGANSTELIIQQLNRKQNESRLMLCQAATGEVRSIYSEKDDAWIDIKSRWNNDDPTGWEWLKEGKEFLWISEKDGWRHLYRLSRDGKKETLITKGSYDVISINMMDEKGGYVYFMASPDNATQAYLYRISLKGAAKPERLTPASQPGTHEYEISPNGKIAFQQFSNANTRPQSTVVSLPAHKLVSGSEEKPANNVGKTEFFQVKTADGVEMDGWMVKPQHFDPNKKYPIVFYVYGEPAGQTVKDSYGTSRNSSYAGDMAEDGYIYASVENRGAPAPKGRAWRKAIYRKIGLINIRDQAMAAREILKWPYVDTSRVAVWGWSGGGSSTLNLLFQYPDIYKTGIAVAAVGNQLSYDNIYQERYMGIPQENREDFIQGSPITHAKNLRGNLLYIHGTGDDNVHYQNAELLFNELIKYNKRFQMMAYPNRTHGISEGEGTRKHLSTLYTQYLKEHCPPGGK